MKANCPIHGSDDMVQSIPALVSGGTYSSPFSYGTMTSAIAIQLVAPPTPTLLNSLDLVFWSVIFFFSVCIIVGPYFVWKEFKYAPVKNPYYQDKLFGHGKGGSYIFMLICAWYPLFWFFIPRYVRKLREESEYDYRYSLYTEAVKKWESLYYCHKCGCVIDPNTSRTFRPDELHAYLRVDDYM